MTNKKLIKAIKKEIKRPAGNTWDAVLLQGLRNALKEKRFKGSDIDFVKKKYGIK